MKFSPLLTFFLWFVPGVVAREVYDKIFEIKVESDIEIVESTEARIIELIRVRKTVAKLLLDLEETGLFIKVDEEFAKTITGISNWLCNRFETCINWETGSYHELS